MSTLECRVREGEAALISLQTSANLLKRDFSFGKYSGQDLKTIREYARKITVRCDGLMFFYRIIDPLRERFPQTPVTSRPPSPSPRGSFTDASHDSPPSTPLRPYSEPLSRFATPPSGNSTPLGSPTRPRLSMNGTDSSVISPSPLHPNVHSAATSILEHHAARPHHPGHTRQHSFGRHVHLITSNSLASLSRLSHVPPLNFSFAGNHLRNRLHLRPPSLFQDRINHGLEHDVGLFESQVHTILILPSNIVS